MEGEFTDIEETKSDRPQTSAFGTMPTGPMRRTATGASGTTAETKSTTRKALEPSSSVAPYLYTFAFNKRQDLLYAGGAGKNEMRVFDWETGNIVAMVSNIPKSILCGETAHRSGMFAFGAADSKVRIFNISA